MLFYDNLIRNDVQTVESASPAVVRAPDTRGTDFRTRPAMVGRGTGGVLLLSEKVANNGDEKLIKYHCIIHEEALAAQTLEMKHVMAIVVKTVNFLKSRGLNHRQFKTFLERSEAVFVDVIYFSVFRWLSRGATLKRFF